MFALPGWEQMMFLHLEKENTLNEFQVMGRFLGGEERNTEREATRESRNSRGSLPQASLIVSSLGSDRAIQTRNSQSCAETLSGRKHIQWVFG